MSQERRIIVTELRAVQSADKRILRGYAAKFGTPSRGLPFVERCKAGCFARAIREKQDVACLMNHDASLLMGRVSNRTLALREDNVGLYFEDELPDTTAAKDLYTLVQRGDISQCSFSFLAKKDSWGKEQNAAGDWQASRTLEDVDLMDVSPCTNPVYTDTQVDTGEQNAFSLQEIEHNRLIPAEIRSLITQHYHEDFEHPESHRRRMEMQLRLAQVDL
jgi:HK97 family phage prohead protease